MIELIHIAPPHRDFQTQRCLEHLRHDLAGNFKITLHTLGPGGDYQNVPAAILALKSANRDRWPLVHAWGLAALSVAVFAGFRRIVFSPDLFYRPMAIGWLRILADRAPVHFACPTAALQQFFLASGIASPIRVIRPGVDFSRLRVERNSKLRAELGVAPNDFLIFSPGESTEFTAHRNAAWAVGIMHALDERYRLLLWGRGSETNLVVRFVRKLRQPNLMISAESRLSRRVRFEELISVADAALISSRPFAPTLPVQICMAAGLPIVSTVTPCLAEILAPRQSAILAPRNTPRMLAQSMHDLLQDPTLSYHIADTARAEARKSFDLPIFLDQYQTLYHQVAARAALQAG